MEGAKESSDLGEDRLPISRVTYAPSCSFITAEDPNPLASKRSFTGQDDSRLASLKKAGIKQLTKPSVSEICPFGMMML